MYGNLVISYRVVIPAHDDGYSLNPEGIRTKRATLANITCEYSKCGSILTEFKEKNPSLNPREICAEFKYSELL